MSIGINVTADVQSTVSGIRQVTKALEDLRAEVSRVNGDLSKLSTDDRALWETLDRNVQQGLQSPVGRMTRERIQRATGNSQPTLQDILDARLDPDPVRDEAAKRNIIGMFGGAPAGGAGRAGAGAGGRALSGSLLAGFAGFAGGGSGLERIGSGVGSAAGYALGGPIGGFIGGAVGAFAGGAVSAAWDTEDRRQLELDTFTRRLGESVGRFDEFNRAIKDAAGELNVSFADLQRRSQIFGDLSGIRGMRGAIAGGEAATALARGFGLDPEATTAQLARMQGGSQNSEAIRRNAVLIGETIARIGFAKPAEVVEKLGAHVERFVDRTLETPNLSAFAQALIAANKTGAPGLVGGGAAGILGQVDATIAAGGGHGEAGRVFQLSALLDANPALRGKVFTTQMLSQAGAFASAESMGLGKGTMTNFEAVLAKLNAAYGKSRFDDNGRMIVDEAGAMKLDAASNLLGLGNSWRAKGLVELQNQLGGSQIGQVERALKAAGFGISDVNLSGLRELATFAGKADLTQPGVLDEVRRLAVSNREDTSVSTMADTQAKMLQYAAESAGYLLEIRNEVVGKAAPQALSNFNDALFGIPGAIFGRSEPAGYRPAPAGSSR